MKLIRGKFQGNSFSCERESTSFTLLELFRELKSVTESKLVPLRLLLVCILGILFHSWNPREEELLRATTTVV